MAKFYKSKTFGMIVCFGYDMRARVDNPSMIHWNCLNSGDWLPAIGNNAGQMLKSNHKFDPEFIRETEDGRLICFQPGLCVEMVWLGGGQAWEFTFSPAREEKWYYDGKGS